MKNKLFIITSLFALVLAGCKKDENKIYFEGATAPVLTASSTSAMVLTEPNKDKPAITFAWTNPDYKFTTGLSSQNVTYVLQIDTAGANFASPKRMEVAISNDLSVSYNVKQFNLLLANWLENIAYNFEFRIKATLANNSVPVYSNVIKINITPYLDVAVPIPTNETLWVTGDAHSSGWSNPLGSPYDVSQKFTRVSKTLYTLTLAMPGGGNYKVIQQQGNWSTQYHMVTGGTWSDGSFEMRDADPGFPGPPTAGTYKITLDFKTGKYKVEKI